MLNQSSTSGYILQPTFSWLLCPTLLSLKWYLSSLPDGFSELILGVIGFTDHFSFSSAPVNTTEFKLNCFRGALPQHHHNRNLFHSHCFSSNHSPFYPSTANPVAFIPPNTCLPFFNLSHWVSTHQHPEKSCDDIKHKGISQASLLMEVLDISP